jgi:acyl dehydratase
MARIDRSLLDRAPIVRAVLVERGAIAFFANAIGETDPVCVDEGAARAAGYRGLVAPPSFVFSLDLFAEADRLWVHDLGVDLSRILHAEQAFEHFSPICAGDVVSLHATITDIAEKKGGLLEFVTREVRAFVDAALTSRMTTTLVVRHG